MDPFRDLAIDAPKQVVVLTGAGASVPLGLPRMDGLLSRDFGERLNVELQIVLSIAENWAGARGESGPVDFERLYTCAEYVSKLHLEDLGALAFAPHRRCSIC